jgi:hypothetical protein
MPGKDDARDGARDDARELVPPLIQEKLAAFERLEPAFRECFLYVEEVHGQRRFTSMPVAATVRYLHALWVCHLKDALLSVPTTTARYDHRRTLDLLMDWHEGDTASVVDFLEHKLDMQTFAQLTAQVEQAETAGDAPLAERLRHGRQILLNRGMNLHAALDAIFALDVSVVRAQVRQACVEYDHTPNAIQRQREMLAAALYSYVPHAQLSRRNMLVMNALGVGVTSDPADRPGARTARVQQATGPLPAYAENPLPGQTEFTPPPFSTQPYYPTNVPPPSSAEGEERIVAWPGE